MEIILLKGKVENLESLQPQKSEIYLDFNFPKALVEVKCFNIEVETSLKRECHN